ncbi:hypothetical protein [Pelosinus sp. sgz500959]|uniref:hypothetical protein n=1 Tax=Pelosinus sp. sgz500959 TaxID=3242472 RepID=UPI003672FF4C
MFWMIGISSVVVFIILGWYYLHNLDWQIKFLIARLNKMIRCQKRDRQAIKSLLKDSYTIINKGMVCNHSTAVYQTLDLLKLAFGHGLVRSGESGRLMAIGISALNNNKPDVVGFVVDAFRPLVRQLSPDDVVIAINQLTLIGVISFKKKQNFLAAKVVDCILFIMEQPDESVERKKMVAAIKALKVLGVLSLRRRDTGLFRELNIRLSTCLISSCKADDMTTEISSMLAAWLHRIIWLNETVLFTVITDMIFNLIGADVLTDDGIEVMIDELGNVAASACLNPNSPLASLILEFMFRLANERKNDRHWTRVVTIAGRVAKLAIYRHGLAAAFTIIHPLLEFGRNLLWAELKFIESVDKIRQRLLFRVVRESLLILSYCARLNLLGSTEETIVDVFKCWMGHSELMINQKSAKKYCQLLLLFWLKNKRQMKRTLSYDPEFIEPILFSSSERRRLGI